MSRSDIVTVNVRGVVLFFGLTAEFGLQLEERASELDRGGLYP